MPRHVAIQPGQLYPQPDYSVAVDREGKWTATQVFLCHRNSITKLMPRPGTPHPDIPFISVDNATAQVSEGDIAQTLRANSLTACGSSVPMIDWTPTVMWQPHEAFTLAPMARAHSTNCSRCSTPSLPWRIAGTLNRHKLMHHLATVLGLCRRAAEVECLGAFGKNKVQAKRTATAANALRFLWDYLGWTGGKRPVALGLIGPLHAEFKSYRQAAELMCRRFDARFPYANL